MRNVFLVLFNTHTHTGFAYGHISTKAVAAAGHVGRGMAAQQLMEELQSRKKLSDRVRGGAEQAGEGVEVPIQTTTTTRAPPALAGEPLD